MKLHKMAVSARLMLPPYLAGFLFIKNPFPDPMLLILTLIMMCAIVTFCDQNTKPLNNRAWFHAETFVRVALVCLAIVNCRDSKEGYVICLLALFIFQGLAMAIQGSNKNTSKLPLGVALGSMALIQMLWLVAHAIAREEPRFHGHIPAAPLWVIGAALVLSMVLVRENLWTSLAGTRLLSAGQKVFMWERMVGANNAQKYWTLVDDYFRDMQWGPKRPWLVAELDTAVAAAPMEYLLAYARDCFYNRHAFPGIPRWFTPNNTLQTQRINLNDALLTAVERQLQAIDNRAAIAWSMATSSQEALGLFERMLNPREPEATLELPAL